MGLGSFPTSQFGHHQREREVLPGSEAGVGSNGEGEDQQPGGYETARHLGEMGQCTGEKGGNLSCGKQNPKTSSLCRKCKMSCLTSIHRTKHIFQHTHCATDVETLNIS